MTSCERYRTELGGYVLDGLEPEEHDAVEAHLAECARCRDELDELVDLPELLAEAWTAPQRAPADLRSRVLDRVGRVRRRRRVPAWAAAVIALVAALAGGGVVAVLDQSPPADTVLTLRGEGPVGLVGEAALTQVDAGVQVDLDLVGVRTADQGYYHAWLHRGDIRVSAGTFVGPPNGEVEVQLLCGGLLVDYERLTVTWHPFDGPAEVVAVEAAFAGPVGDVLDDPWTP
jgi:hypothetical protein